MSRTFTSALVPSDVKSVMGSTTTTSGAWASTCWYTVVRWRSRPSCVGRLAWIRSSPASIHGWRSIADRRHVADELLDPTPRRPGRGSARPRRQAASAKAAANVVFPVPDSPEIIVVLPLNQPPRPTMASRSGTPGGHHLVARLVVEVERGDRHDADPVGVDHEGVLVGAVSRAPLLDDADPPHGDLVGDPVVEGDDAVGHVLLEAVAGERALAPLGGHDGGHAPGLEPAEQAAQLGPELGGVVEGGEQHLQGVQDDPLRPHLVDGEADPDEERLEVVVAGLVDPLALDLDVVDDQHSLRAQPVEVPAQGRDVGRQLLGRLLEGQEDARLAHRRTPDEELDAQQRLAAPGPAGDEGRPPPGQAARGDLVEAGDAGRAVRQRGGSGPVGSHDAER